MKPPYEITSEILRLIALISTSIGEINANLLDKPSPKLRKQNKIRSIHHSLKIEGNTLSEKQITALVDNKRILGPEKDIREVLNAIEVYDRINKYNPFSENSFLLAHQTLLSGLIIDAGKYRKKGVGVVKGNQVAHLAPPFSNVPFLMKDLFKYVKEDDDLILIKSCVFHYELEFIHPFMDGNGRMGRLWQNLILKEEYPLFEFISLETIISNSQNEYYQALSDSDKQGKATIFIEYMLGVINNSLISLGSARGRSLNQVERLNYFMELDKEGFSRKDYMATFKRISTATASRDLKKGIELKMFNKVGDKVLTRYIKIKT